MSPAPRSSRTGLAPTDPRDRPGARRPSGRRRTDDAGGAAGTCGQGGGGGGQGGQERGGGQSAGGGQRGGGQGGGGRPGSGQRADCGGRGRPRRGPEDGRCRAQGRSDRRRSLGRLAAVRLLGDARQAAAAAAVSARPGQRTDEAGKELRAPARGPFLRGVRDFSEPEHGAAAPRGQEAPRLPRQGEGRGARGAVGEERDPAGRAREGPEPQPRDARRDADGHDRANNLAAAFDRAGKAGRDRDAGPPALRGHAARQGDLRPDGSLDRRGPEGLPAPAPARGQLEDRCRHPRRAAGRQPRARLPAAAARAARAGRRRDRAARGRLGAGCPGPGAGARAGQPRVPAAGGVGGQARRPAPPGRGGASAGAPARSGCVGQDPARAGSDRARPPTRPAEALGWKSPEAALANNLPPPAPPPGSKKPRKAAARDRRRCPWRSRSSCRRCRPTTAPRWSCARRSIAATWSWRGRSSTRTDTRSGSPRSPTARR